MIGWVYTIPQQTITLLPRTLSSRHPTGPYPLTIKHISSTVKCIVGVWTPLCIGLAFVQILYLPLKNGSLSSSGEQKNSELVRKWVSFSSCVKKKIFIFCLPCFWYIGWLWSDSQFTALLLQEHSQPANSPKRRKLDEKSTSHGKSTPKRSCSSHRSATNPGSASKSKTTNSHDPRLNSGTTKHTDAELKQAADIVIRYLMPHYKEGRFASKVSVK